MALPVLQSLVGIAKESTYGTPATATAFIPVDSAPKTTDKLKMDEDKAWRGAMGVDYGFQPGIYDTQMSLSSYVFPDTVGWALAGVLGDVVTSGGTNAGSSTTTTGATTVGATVIPVTSATGITTGTVLSVDTGANNELCTVASVASLNVTVTSALKIAHTSGAAVQPVVAPFTHGMSLYNGTNGQPKSYTVTDWYVANGRQYPGAVFNDCSFKISGDGLISYTMGIDALPSVSLGGTKPTSSFTTVTPLSGWQGAVQIGGVSSTAVLSFECNMKRKVSPIHTIAGQQGAQSVFAADLNVSGKLDVVMTDDSQLLNYLNNSQPALDVNYSIGSGANAQQFKLHMSKAAYTAATVDRSKEFVQLSITYTAVFNTTDIGASGGFSPVKATIQNAVTPGTYA